MKTIPLVLLAFLLNACDQIEVRESTSRQSENVSKNEFVPQNEHSTNKQANKLSISDFSITCKLSDNDFNTETSKWLISDLIKLSDKLYTDLDDDNKNEEILLLQPTETLYTNCKSIPSDEVMLILQSTRTQNLVKEKINIGFASLPKLNKISNGFSISYEVGQSIKCDNIIEFTLNNELVIDKIKTICYVP